MAWIKQKMYLRALNISKDCRNSKLKCDIAIYNYENNIHEPAIKEIGSGYECIKIRKWSIKNSNEIFDLNKPV